jgi:cytochrome c-type biogenesis protein CcmH/NrfF
MRRAALLLALLAALIAPATALGVQPRASFNDVEDEVMCDTCNVPLNIAESARADQERKEIRGLIARGLTKEQIKARLKAEYGPAILALPDSRGFNLAVYAVPIAVVAILLAALALGLPRWRRRPPGGAAGGRGAGPELGADDARRLDDDLARHGV